MNDKHVCDFEKEILTFEAITLFYDQSDKIYQEKPVLMMITQGEMKIILKTSSGDKKLLGNVMFDVAEYANTKK